MPANTPSKGSMRQVSLDTPGTFSSGDVPLPKLGPGQALVKSGAVGMCGTDYHAYDGTQNFFTYPRVLGHELGVTIVEVADDEVAKASGLKAGDRCAVVPYWECGNCVACKWGKPNCSHQSASLGYMPMGVCVTTSFVL